MELYIKNINNPEVEVYHKNLCRLDNESIFKSICPFCADGILLVRRHPQTLELENHDVCISCGQHVKYLDLGEQ